MYYKSIYTSPIGNITLACDGKSLVGLWLAGQKHFGATLPEETEEDDSIPIFGAAKEWLDRYFSGEKLAVDELQLAPAGSEFRRQVWEILLEIPYGEVTTYGAIAKKMVAKMKTESMSGRAVGGAVGHNPISIIIPCHRVIGSNGSLTGYAGGVETKMKLLKLEGVDTSKF